MTGVKPLSDPDVPGPFRRDEWLRYEEYKHLAAMFAVLGVLVVAIGMDWYFYGVSDFIVETAEGVTFVEGGGKSGFLGGPIMAACGVILVTFGHWFYKEASVLREGAERRAEIGLIVTAVPVVAIVAAILGAVEDADGGEQ